MNVAIVGNAQVNTEKIKDIATMLTESGLDVRYPTLDSLETSEDFSIIEVFKRIDWANIILAVPREGISFDAIVTSEIAYAKHCKKPVFIYYE